MHCRNCGNTTGFVLVVELSIIAWDSNHFTAPDWAFALECVVCASTDVEGDPVAVLAARLG